MTTTSSTPPGLVRRILRSPPVRIGVLGFLLLMMMGLNTDVMTICAGEPFIRSTVTGPDRLTGGNFGVESSVLSLLLCTSTGIVMVVMAVKRGKVVPPIWKRSG